MLRIKLFPLGILKIVPSFFSKEKYVLHYKYLQLYLRKGSKKVHGVLEFYTKRRIVAEKNGGKDGKAFYKLMNNAVYGKTMENF